MKKMIMMCAAAFLLSACAGMNKNTVNYQMSKYDSAKYYVVAGEGMSKNEAAQNALTNMQREMVQNAPVAADQGVVPDLIANADVEKCGGMRTCPPSIITRLRFYRAKKRARCLLRY